jgi:DNA-binding transcriptional ArsR family regulator
LVTELQFRGLDQAKSDSALRLLVHVHSTQDSTAPETGGILVEDIINSYPLDVVQASAELFLERLVSHGMDAYRLKWGYEEAAKLMERQLWDNAETRWGEFVQLLDGRYLGFFLPVGEDDRIISNWKLRKDLKWFSVEVPKHGWNVLRLIDDIIEVAWKLDLAFGFRPFGLTGAEGERVLLHPKAYESLKALSQAPPEALLQGIRVWKFFSEYDIEGSDIVELMNECGVTLDEVVAQVDKFFEKGLTSKYRDGQYPPYFINDKMKKEFRIEVRTLLHPMEAWLSRSEVTGAPEPHKAVPANLPRSSYNSE